MPNYARVARGGGTAVLLGLLLGAALQLQQPALWSWPTYALLAGPVLALGVVLSFPLSLWERAGARAAFALLAATLLAFSLVGLRASRFAGQALDPLLEGRDVTVTGVVAAMPQRNDLGLRFRFEVQSAEVGGVPVRLPPQLYLGWYGGARAGGADTFELQRQAPGPRIRRRSGWPTPGGIRWSGRARACATPSCEMFLTARRPGCWPH